MGADSNRAFASRVLAQRPLTLASLRSAALFGFELALCAVLLIRGLDYLHWPGAIWAVVSAALILQPGLDQSIVSSLVRIAGNLAGASTGTLIAINFGRSAYQIGLTLILVVLLCELCRLDLGLKSACASAIIVMTTHEAATVWDSSLQRLASVAVGCLVALLVQATLELAKRLIRHYKAN